MANPIIFPIKETLVELRKLKQKETSSVIKKRLLVLIEFKKNETYGISKLAVSKTTLVNHNSVLKWRNIYIKEGLQGLLKPSLSRKPKPCVLNATEHKAIEEKLKTPTNGINGYKELMDWVKKELNIEIKYITLVKYVQRNFGAKLKVARKSHIKKNPQAVEDFKKNFSHKCQEVLFNSPLEFQDANLYFQDESRFGLFTKPGRFVTAVGVKPICPFQQKFESTYIFGTVSPIDGDSFMLELPACNTDNFQLFLDEFSKHQPEKFKIMVLDNGAFHKTKTLIIPQNIGLIFLPPYSPELSPIERIWQTMKRDFTNLTFSTLDELSIFIETAVKKLTKNTIMNTCSYPYIFAGINWTI